MVNNCVAVLGNCQAEGVVLCLKHINADLDVTSFPVNSYKTLEEREKAARDLEDFDIVFSQKLVAAHYGAFQIDQLSQRLGRKMVLYPHVGFRGYHPDFVYLFGPEGKVLRSPVWTYHSIVTVAAFLLDIPAEKAVNLFNRYIFTHLDYYREYDRAVAAMDKYCRDLGYDATPGLHGWSGDAFMHTIDHPTVEMLFEVALAAAYKAGLVNGSVSKPDGLNDRLLIGAILPVYPDIARPLGVNNGTQFKRDDRLIAKGKSEAMGLEEFIAESYEIYRNADPAYFDNPKVVTATEAISSL